MAVSFAIFLMLMQNAAMLSDHVCYDVCYNNYYFFILFLFIALQLMLRDTLSSFILVECSIAVSVAVAV